MKSFFIQLFLAVAAGLADNSTGTVEPTSDKLTALKNQYAEAWKNMLTMSDPFSKETKDAKLALYKLEGEIKAEEAAIQKAINDQKIAEARNQRIAMNSAQFAAYDALQAAKADKKTAPEKLAELQTAFDTAREAVENELLAKYASSSPARKSVAKSTDGQETGDKHANTAAIVELYLQGKTNKEIEELGYKRSTVWHAINNYKKANATA